ncbi:hypothetical protein J2855_002162 [Agrobacterium tumefaciens]|uniref:hypothetical protein n=1 Tax=Agrobacterium tumefaciens TaxID=358 RepID=UPI001AE6B2E4|nr:hypothetical protein [Agrobacterium tumefaciens]MBP2508527.1 hypothetical protein [Agrobacterium tumefaciens]MBP2517679.1 hypothetical protein [Agrobacterium tumefaciens]MBP2576313.1 hypothetical protein [Agrobacterium tumefaciens]MBP2594669.1 hypothetical protein [Agrobacterium tumefaciens]
MSVINDLQLALTKIAEEFKDKSAIASLKQERLMCILNYAMALHSLYVKMQHFEPELAAEGDAWTVVVEGEEFYAKVVPSLLLLLANAVKTEQLVKPMSDDDRSAWDATKEFAKELWEALCKSVHDAREAISDYHDSAKEWQEKQWKDIKEKADKISDDETKDGQGGK